MASSFAFVDMIRKRVRPQTAVKVLRGHLWYGGRATGGITGSSNGTSATVSRNSENSR